MILNFLLRTGNTQKIDDWGNKYLTSGTYRCYRINEVWNEWASVIAPSSCRWSQRRVHVTRDTLQRPS